MQVERRKPEATGRQQETRATRARGTPRRPGPGESDAAPAPNTAMSVPTKLQSPLDEQNRAEQSVLRG
jgi:hypothetical protein